MMIQSLQSIARAAYAESAAKADTESAANEAAASEEFLADARRRAQGILGEAAADGLNWRYTPWAESAEDTEEAVAVLPPGRAHSFALHYTRTEESDTLALAASCLGCGCRTLTPVISLVHLGQLFDEADSQNEQHGDDGTAGDEPDSLTFVTRLEGAAGRVAMLARRLLARHPEAGLSVESLTAYGHRSGARVGRVRLSANDAETVMRVAEVLGAEPDVKVHDVGGLAGAYRWAIVTQDIDDIEVEISGNTQLPEEEAAAWRAAQPQADTDVQENGASGLPSALAETGGES